MTSPILVVPPLNNSNIIYPSRLGERSAKVIAMDGEFGLLDIKRTKRGLMEISQVDDVNCHARTLQNIIDRTTKIRVNLPKDHKLCLTEVKKEDQVRSVKPAIVTSRIQGVMQEVGIDTSTYRAYSLRAAVNLSTILFLLQPENSATSSEPETEATGIGTRIPCNHTVAGVDGEDEMVAHPFAFN
ncbi:hypothetical protein RO3G_02054 [Rhizopus delemar RA 99-880]|uniref:Uncharacterized protein n=1 Tax=Rhizopus delemar (strain RA 99-880 / ATCC MYA-4621 / FGSC 9543 / NRRL 43880) TaxID=246409 RepID=I1BMC0_RHIO9|nr:hypothetical protein RO3G_02054 [Rhizopus delemar RA 99-880]|eukprot:EIE77350.1 hypothetical protein RO3G_02054 [Rhizopus delemar RA 99-880]